VVNATHPLRDDLVVNATHPLRDDLVATAPAPARDACYGRLGTAHPKDVVGKAC
jgi:hypothetical protein